MVEAVKKEYSLEEAAEILNEDISILQYWQREINMPERFNGKKQLIYTQADVETFRFIMELRNGERMGLKAIKRVVQKTGILELCAADYGKEKEQYKSPDEGLKDKEGNASTDAKGKKEQACIEPDTYDNAAGENMEYSLKRKNGNVDHFIDGWRKKKKKKSFIKRIFMG